VAGGHRAAVRRSAADRREPVLRAPALRAGRRIPCCSRPLTAAHRGLVLTVRRRAAGYGTGKRRGNAACPCASRAGASWSGPGRRRACCQTLQAGLIAERRIGKGCCAAILGRCGPRSMLASGPAAVPRPRAAACCCRRALITRWYPPVGYSRGTGHGTTRERAREPRQSCFLLPGNLAAIAPVGPANRPRAAALQYRAIRGKNHPRPNRRIERNFPHFPLFARAPSRR